MEIIVYAGNAGDRNDRGMRGAVELGTALAELYSSPAQIVGEAIQPASGGWVKQLRAATPNLRRLAQSFAISLEKNDRPVATMGRCAASVATLPMIAQRFPDIAIVWFDAHGDCNVPVGPYSADTSYLGGMVLTGAAGEWESGLGRGLDLANVVLVGARDLDPPEQARIDSGQITFVPVGEKLGPRLQDALRGRRVYVHLDCDVLEEGLIATEYQVSGGLGWAELREAFEILALHDPLGLEITEYESSWPTGEQNEWGDLLLSIHPVIATLQAASAP